MSALVDKIYTFDDLVTFDQNGLSIASFVDIKRTIINRMRQLYGVDIDVSDASVDGQWITELSLLINNILQALNNMYANLNPNTAQGKALDILASFSNISRKPAQASICNITLTSSFQFSLNAETEFIDKSGLIWRIDKSRESYLPELNQTTNSYVFDATSMRQGVTIPLICTSMGAIDIPKNSIISFVNVDSSNAIVLISQPTDGIKGSIAESDVHLRARRNKSGANESTTIAEGIQGALMSNVNIIDAFIYNHDADHTSEIIVRRKFDSQSKVKTTLDDVDSFIGSIIYSKLTPGIPSICDSTTSTAYTDPSATDTGLNVQKAMISDPDALGTVEIARWVNAKPIKPVIAITLHTLANFDKTIVCKNIIEAVTKYANDLDLLIDLDASAILQEILFADPKFQGRSTYYISPADVKLAGQIFTFKPSKSTHSSPAAPLDVSATIRKTYYAYNTNCVISDIKIDNIDYIAHNDDNTILIAINTGA